MALQNELDHARLRVPYGHCVVARCRRQQAAVKIVRDTPYSFRVMLEHGNAGVEIPMTGAEHERPVQRPVSKAGTYRCALHVGHEVFTGERNFGLATAGIKYELHVRVGCDAVQVFLEPFCKVFDLLQPMQCRSVTRSYLLSNGIAQIQKLNEIC